jgi:hypothetical protein
MDLYSYVVLLERHRRTRTKQIKKILPAAEHTYEKAVTKIYL